MNEGFFTKEEIESRTKEVRKQRIRRTPNCNACKLYKNCRSPKMQATGKGTDVLFVAEAPGRVEDARGIQLVGPAGNYIRSVLKKLGFSLDDHGKKMNAINCRPPNNRTPTQKEIEHCRPMILSEIKSLKPRVIILLGGTAIRSLIGHRWKKNLGGVQKWRGWTIPDRDFNAWLCPTFHPSFLIRQTTSKVAGLIFKQDLKRALNKRNKSFPKIFDERECIKILKKPKNIESYLRKLLKHDELTIAFDYETTGRKPQAEGHRIVSCAISTRRDEAVAFPLYDDNKQTLMKILRHDGIKKIASNLKFEEIWSRHCLKTNVEGWIWDTMQAAHVLDNRKAITSIKFQAYINFGLIDYDSHIEKFLETPSSESDNAFNRIDECDLNELLIYNGLDAMLEFRLAKKQMRQILK